MNTLVLMGEKKLNAPISKRMMTKDDFETLDFGVLIFLGTWPPRDDTRGPAYLSTDVQRLTTVVRVVNSIET
jgi:hypothetical protein